MHMINGQMPIYKYAQSHNIILQQYVSVTPVAIIRVSNIIKTNNKPAISIQIIVQKCMIKPLHVVLYYSVALLVAIIFIHSAFCLTTGPKPLPKRFLHIVRFRASYFK
jgi:hypothetical protein